VRCGTSRFHAPRDEREATMAVVTGPALRVPSSDPGHAVVDRPHQSWGMGFLRRNDGPDGERFVMREKLLSVGDDFWIEK
jgi:hypothetical protein